MPLLSQMDDLDASLSNWSSRLKGGQHEGMQEWLTDAVKQLPVATNAWCATPDSMQQRMLSLVRLLRNAPALGGKEAADALVAAQAADALAHAVLQLHGAAAHPPMPPSSLLESPAAAAGAANSEQHAAVCTVLSQALHNLASSGAAGSGAVWDACWGTGAWLHLLQHPSDKVSEPATGALFACIRTPANSSVDAAAANRAAQLCSPSQAARVWSALIARAVPGLVQGASFQLVPSSSQAHPTFQDMEEEASEWLQLLVGALSFTHGLLPELLLCVAVAGQSADTATTAVAWGPFTPPLLYILAHEAQHKPSSSDQASADTAVSESSCHGLDALVHLMLEAAEACSATGSSAGSSSTLNELGRHVLEASLQALRCLAQRDDMGIGLCRGSDPVAAMCSPPNHLDTHLLRMLAALPPPQKLRDAKGKVVTSATGADAGDEASTSARTPQTPQLQVPAAPGLVQGPVPSAPPYLGYRGDVLSVLANAMFKRPHVAERVAAVPGAVELVLSQCALDDTAPLGREWALWAVRNLCAGSAVAREAAAALKPVGAVETPELSKLGLKLEMDAVSGKMQIVKLDDPNVVKVAEASVN